jgi:hypothetical protein
MRCGAGSKGRRCAKWSRGGLPPDEERNAIVNHLTSAYNVHLIVSQLVSNSESR